MEEEKVSDGVDEVEDDVAVSMVDILAEEEKLQQDADAVLGGSDDRNCTYIMGYVERQALYSCKTCAAEASNGEMAGVCLACSLECHEGHELVELYTKRNFRCDCGNSKFKEFSCKLCPDKMPSNPDNRYNHNYLGLYCTCSRPYPDPDDSIEDEMIQCVVCEDWFHKRHIGSFAVEDEFDEMTCGSCMDSYPFLWHYARFCKAIYNKKKPSDTHEPSTTIDVLNSIEPSNNSCSVKEPASENSCSAEAINELPATSSSVTVCRLNELQQESKSALQGAVFWPENWRKQLCQCTKCIEMYRKLNVIFLIYENDTIAAYEEHGKSKASKSSYQQGLEALSKLDRVQQMDLIHEYNDFKSHLKDYLKKFAENKKVVRQEDVNEFFTQMAAKKRLKTEEPSISYFCK